MGPSTDHTRRRELLVQSLRCFASFRDKKPRTSVSEAGRRWSARKATRGAVFFEPLEILKIFDSFSFLLFGQKVGRKMSRAAQPARGAEARARKASRSGRAGSKHAPPKK